jgi:hypothetical protein
MEPLHIRKLADTSSGTRVKRFNQDTGEPYLLNPETGQAEPWPLLGVEVVGDAPQVTRVPTSWVTRGVAEGWLELVNGRMEHRPGGPPEDPWKVTHSFQHADAIRFKTVDGEPEVVYNVTHQPDKYADDGDGLSDDVTPVTDQMYREGNTRVDWFYDLALDRPEEAAS